METNLYRYILRRSLRHQVFLMAAILRATGGRI